jgi:hypothetical protein
MSDATTKSVDEVLREVREELTRLNRNQTPSLPRFSIDGALRVVERPETGRAAGERREAAAS